jgi:hypothetical protein
MSLRQRHGNAMAKTGRAAGFWAGKFRGVDIVRLVPLAFSKDSEKGESNAHLELFRVACVVVK